MIIGYVRCVVNRIFFGFLIKVRFKMSVLLGRKVVCFFASIAMGSLFASKENFPLEIIVEKKISMFEAELMPFLDDFSQQDALEVVRRYKYLSDLNDDNELLNLDFSLERYGSDVWHLNKALSCALGESEGCGNFCKDVDLRTVCPPLFWDYSLLFEIDPSVADKLISMYFRCVSREGEMDEMVVAVCSQMILLLNGENLSAVDTFYLIDWSMDAAQKVQELRKDTGRVGLDTMKSSFVLFIENMWTQNRQAFFPYIYCLSGNDFDLKKIGDGLIFSQDLLNSFCENDAGDRFLLFVEENEMFSDQIDRIRDGDVSIIFE